MRGQGPGSEHERREAGGAPPTPPPSFGRRPPSEQGGPPAFPDDPAAQAWLTVEGEPPRADAWQPAGAAPADTWLSVEEPGASRPDSADVPPVIGQPLPGAQPWEVQDAEGAAYDWYADDEEPAGVSASPARQPETSWGEPGAPRWDPPPAFTAAAAGMQVWPAPVTDSPAMPPWPAATGELEPDDDTPALHGGTHRPDSRPPSEPPKPQGQPIPWAAAGPVPPGSADGWGAEPERAGPSRYFDPPAKTPRPVPLSAPTPADQDAPPPSPEGQSPYGTDAEELYPAEDPRPPYGVEPTRPSYDHQSEGDVETRPGQVPPFSRGPGLGAGVPVQTPGPKGPPAPLFDPKRSPAAQQGAATPTSPMGAPGSRIEARATDTPDGEPRPGRHPDPSDVPVWPPAPQRDDPDRDHLDLPFAPEVLGHQPTPHPEPRDERPSPSESTDPQGGPTAPRPDAPTASPEPPATVIQGVPVPPPGSIAPHRIPAPQTNTTTTPSPPGLKGTPPGKPGSPPNTSTPRSPAPPPSTTPPHGTPRPPSTTTPPHGTPRPPYATTGTPRDTTPPHGITGTPPGKPGSLPDPTSPAPPPSTTTPSHGTPRPPYATAGTPHGEGPPYNAPESPRDTTPTGVPHGGLVPQRRAPLAGQVPVQGEPAGHQGELAPLREGGGAPFRQPPLTPIQVQEPPKSKRALFATLGVLVLAGVATGGFFAVRSANTSAPSGAATSAQATNPTTEPTAAPAVTTPAQPAGASVLNSEITDPKTLSIKEAFPEKKVDAAGATFTRVKTEVADDCTDAASGPFAEALETQKCSRVLRATYVDRKRRYAVTTGIAVLPSKDAAVEVDRTKNLDRNLWFRGLAGPDGSGGDRVHIAGGYAAGLVWGRYIVFSYATHADGHTPNGKEKTLVKVSSEFRDETAKVLERRITDS